MRVEFLFLAAGICLATKTKTHCPECDPTATITRDVDENYVLYTTTQIIASPVSSVFKLKHSHSTFSTVALPLSSSVDNSPNISLDQVSNTSEDNSYTTTAATAIATTTQFPNVSSSATIASEAFPTGCVLSASACPPFPSGDDRTNSFSNSTGQGTDAVYYPAATGSAAVEFPHFPLGSGHSGSSDSIGTIHYATASGTSDVESTSSIVALPLLSSTDNATNGSSNATGSMYATATESAFSIVELPTFTATDNIYGYATMAVETTTAESTSTDTTTIETIATDSTAADTTVTDTTATATTTAPFSPTGNRNDDSRNPTATDAGDSASTVVSEAQPTGSSTTAIQDTVTPTTSTFLREPTSYPCDKWHLIVARGTSETAGTAGSLSKLVDMIKDNGVDKYGKKNHGVQNAYIHYLNYPAELLGIDVSLREGATEVKNLLRDLTVHATCPEKNMIVMLGINQGAQVIQDGLCGGGALDYYDTYNKRILGSIMEPEPQETQDRVASIIQFSDPRYTLNDTRIHHGGNADNRSTLAPRGLDSPQCLGTTLKKFRSYCAYNDLYCDNGYATEKNGAFYTDRWGWEVVGYINDQIKLYVREEELARDQIATGGIIPEFDGTVDGSSPEYPHCEKKWWNPVSWFKC